MSLVDLFKMTFKCKNLEKKLTVNWFDKIRVFHVVRVFMMLRHSYCSGFQLSVRHNVSSSKAWVSRVPRLFPQPIANTLFNPHENCSTFSLPLNNRSKKVILDMFRWVQLRSIKMTYTLISLSVLRIFISIIWFIVIDVHVWFYVRKWYKIDIYVDKKALQIY